MKRIAFYVLLPFVWIVGIGLIATALAFAKDGASDVAVLVPFFSGATLCTLFGLYLCL